MPADAAFPQFMTVNEVAVALRVSRATVYRLVSSGALAANHVGKSVWVTRPAVEEFLRRHARPAADVPDERAQTMTGGRNRTTPDPYSTDQIKNWNSRR